MIVFIFWFREANKVLHYAREKYGEEYGPLPRAPTTLPQPIALWRNQPSKNWLRLAKEHPEEETIKNIWKIHLKYGILAFFGWIIANIIFILVVFILW